MVDPANKKSESKTMITLLLFCLSIFIFMSLWFYNELGRSQKRRHLSYLAADELRQSSDDLTRMVRTYVATKDPRYETMYWDILAIRNGQKERPVRYENIYWDFVASTNEKPRPDGQKISLIEMMKELGFTKEEFAKLAAAEIHSSHLVKTEMIAMHAVKGKFLDADGEFTSKREPDYDYARSILFDEKYHKDKLEIMTPIDEFFVMVDARTEAKVTRDMIYTSVSIILVFVTIISLLWSSRAELNKLKKAKKEILEKNEQLRSYNQQLRAYDQQLRIANQQLKANENQLEGLVKVLEFKNMELQDIVYTASHDLRSPLVNILGFSVELNNNCNKLEKLLTAQGEETDKSEQIKELINEEIPQALEFISGSASKMSNLLNGLLQVSRVGTVEMNSQSIDMNKAIAEVLAGVEHQIKEHDVKVTIDVLPDCTGDAVMLHNVFTNLVGNAIKYFDPSRPGEITISGKVEDFMCVYCVTDNGMGIEAGHMRKVFDLFHRLNPDDKVGGEGLGLTIVTRILNRLGGQIWVESEFGKGSKFFVSLPAAIAEKV